MINITALLEALTENDGSDLHLKVGAPPIIRVDGKLIRLEGRPLTAEDTEMIAHSIMPADRRDALEKKNEADFAHSVTGLGRFRVNVFRQRGSVTLVLRRVRFGSATFEELGLPAVIKDLSDAARGLILVTGPTGSGKTTTLGAMIQRINATRPVHILTIEDPIEILHRDEMASVNQREIGVDTDNYVIAMRAAMREDPDVILIGEMRDNETVAAALAASETGHLVMSTLHTTDAVETVNRVVDFFPPFQQNQIRVALASTLRGVICQRLVQRVNGGRVPCLEIMVNNGRIADRILDSDTTSEITDIISEGAFYGMQTFDQSLLGLVQAGVVTVDAAMGACSKPHDFKLLLEQAGLTSPLGANAT